MQIAKLLLCGAAAGIACGTEAATLIGVRGSGGTPKEVASLNTTSGVITAVGSVSSNLSQSSDGYAVDSYSKKAYLQGYNYSGVYGGSDEYFFVTINLTNGAVTTNSLGSGGYTAFDFYRTNLLAGFRGSGAQKDIVLINPLTGTGAVVATPPVTYVTMDAFAVDPNTHRAYLQSTDYGSPTSILYVITLTNGAVTNVSLGTNSYTSLESYQTNRLIGARSNGGQREIVLVDVATGTGGVIATVSVGSVLADGFALDAANHRAYFEAVLTNATDWTLVTVNLTNGGVTTLSLGTNVLSGLDVYDPSAGAGTGVQTTNVVNDYDRDGRSDYAVYGQSAGYWYILETTGGLVYGAFGGTAYEALSGDFDGDGKADPAVFSAASGLWMAWLSRQPGLDSVQFTGTGLTPVVGDFDGDGSDDAAVYRAQTGYWTWRASSAGGQTNRWFGATGYDPVPGDFDGDGKTDLAVYQEASGYWYVQPSSAIESYTWQAFGASGYTPVEGDYDGDRKTDYAVYHETSGYWYVLPSSTGAYYAQWFGATGYQPVVGDYDGDGKDDLTVYREVSGDWYTRLSGTGGIATQNFGAPGYVPVE